MKRRLRRRLIRKITAAVSLLFVFGVIYYFITGFFGNPVDAVIAGHKIKNYVHEKYPDNDFEISGAKYNFKTGSYMSLIQSKTIKDMRFYVSCRKGKISDSYEYDVDGRYMTYWRLASEFNDRVEEIIKSGFKEKTDIVIGDFIKKDDDYSMLSLDMPLDITNPPFDTQLTTKPLLMAQAHNKACFQSYQIIAIATGLLYSSNTHKSRFFL